MISNSDISKVIAGVKGQINEQDTSLIVAHLPLLEKRLQHLTQSFPSETLHAIAIKTNPHPQMLKHLVGLGYGLEAASIEEVIWPWPQVVRPLKLSLIHLLRLVAR